LPSPIAKAIRLYLVLLVAMTAFEWGFAYCQAHLFHASYPRTTPLFNPAERFSDWTNFTERVAHYGEPGMMTRKDLGLPYPYPLPTIYLYLVFVRLFPDSTHAYIVFTVSAFVLITLLFSLYLTLRLRARLLVHMAVWATLICGSPAMFLLDRGNIEVFLWLFVLFGLVTYVRRWHTLAAVLFALAACMKIYPALFFLLFLPRRQFKPFFLGIAAAGLFTVATLAAIGPTIASAWHAMSASAEALRELQIETVADNGLRFDHSFLALYKQAAFEFLMDTHRASYRYPPVFSRATTVYSVIAPLAFLAVYLFRLRRMPLLNQFIALTLCSILLPYVSYEYTLVHVYLVFAVFLLFVLQDVCGHDLASTSIGNAATLNPSQVRSLMICFAITFAPLARIAREQYQGQIKCLALLAMLLVALQSPMPSTLFGDRRPLVASTPPTL
jgi:hypothetical protein